MLDHPLPDIDSWTLLFNSNSLPVLRVTKRRLDEMRADLDRVDVRELARLILQDPIMTVRVLAFIQPMRGRSLQRDITTIASAVMMALINLGVPADRILLEPDALHTDENMYRALAIALAPEGGDAAATHRLVVKGAFAQTLAVCSHWRHQGQAVPLSDADRRQLDAFVQAQGGQGLRVLAVATRELPAR